jgi:LysM repeat protein
MSVATEFAPLVYIPPPAREPRRPLADVVVLHPPGESSTQPGLRLTRRGAAVLAVLVAVVGVALVWVAALSAPSHAGGVGAGPKAAAPASVVVDPGDTLWSIATQIAPGTDPGREVARLQQLNHLAGVALAPGQVLRTQ